MITISKTIIEDVIRNHLLNSYQQTNNPQQWHLYDVEVVMEHYYDSQDEDYIGPITSITCYGKYERFTPKTNVRKTKRIEIPITL